MPQDLRIALRLDADSKGFQGEVRLGAKALEQLTGSANRTSAASRRLARTTGQVEAAARRSGGAVRTMHQRILQYGTALLGIHTALSASRGLLRQADAFTRISNSVRLATGSAEAYARVQSELVETMYWVRDVVEKGPEWFASQGRHGGKGLRSYSVSGRVRSPGVKLAPAGITLRELIDEFCGGMAEGHMLRGYLPGGASGGVLPASMADLPLEFGKLEAHGCFGGSQ